MLSAELSPVPRSQGTVAGTNDSPGAVCGVSRVSPRRSPGGQALPRVALLGFSRSCKPDQCRTESCQEVATGRIAGPSTPVLIRPPPYLHIPDARATRPIHITRTRSRESFLPFCRSGTHPHGPTRLHAPCRFRVPRLPSRAGSVSASGPVPCTGPSPPSRSNPSHRVCVRQSCSSPVPTGSRCPSRHAEA